MMLGIFYHQIYKWNEGTSKNLADSMFTSICKLKSYSTQVIPYQGTITRNDLNELISEISSSSKSLYYLAEEIVYFLRYVLTQGSCRNRQASYLVSQLYKSSCNVEKWLNHSLRLVKRISAEFQQQQLQTTLQVGNTK